MSVPSCASRIYTAEMHPHCKDHPRDFKSGSIKRYELTGGCQNKQQSAGSPNQVPAFTSKATVITELVGVTGTRLTV